jgi:hypothetical protein
MTGIHPSNAVCLIERAIHDNWNARQLMCQLQADHSTDDADSKINKKTKCISTIYDLIERHKEIVLGSVKILDGNGHLLKSYISHDSKRSSKAHQEQKASRQEATLAHFATLDESVITSFFKPRIYDVGVQNLNLQEFLRTTCLPHWTNEYREYLKGKEDLFSSPRAAISTPTNLPEESEDDDKKPRATKRSRST